MKIHKKANLLYKSKQQIFIQYCLNINQQPQILMDNQHSYSLRMTAVSFNWRLLFQIYSFVLRTLHFLLYLNEINEEMKNIVETETMREED